mmetsp:Transcript_8110/g.23329  ORF Transcript_8110/g.23329 Transcript_8110/m.23329 type:complete len:225 (+) Transcript_8110:577-1251(+)
MRLVRSEGVVVFVAILGCSICFVEPFSVRHPDHFRGRRPVFGHLLATVSTAKAVLLGGLVLVLVLVPLLLFETSTWRIPVQKVVAERVFGTMLDGPEHFVHVTWRVPSMHGLHHLRIIAGDEGHFCLTIRHRFGILRLVVEDAQALVNVRSRLGIIRRPIGQQLHQIPFEWITRGRGVGTIVYVVRFLRAQNIADCGTFVMRKGRMRFHRMLFKVKVIQMRRFP